MTASRTRAWTGSAMPNAAIARLEKIAVQSFPCMSRPVPPARPDGIGAVQVCCCLLRIWQGKDIQRLAVVGPMNVREDHVRHIFRTSTAQSCRYRHILLAV